MNFDRCWQKSVCARPARLSQGRLTHLKKAKRRLGFSACRRRAFRVFLDGRTAKAANREARSLERLVPNPDKISSKQGPKSPSDKGFRAGPGIATLPISERAASEAAANCSRQASYDCRERCRDILRNDDNLARF
jgi:hypothetical protein